MHERVSNLVRLAAIATLPMFAQPVWAWGDKGHETIATIAKGRLTPATKKWVDAILAQDVDTLTAPGTMISFIAGNTISAVQEAAIVTATTK